MILIQMHSGVNMLDATKAVDIIQSINGYLENNGGQDLNSIMEITQVLMKNIDQMENIANGIPSEYYKNQILLNVQKMRQNIIDTVDSIDDMYNQTNR